MIPACGDAYSATCGHFRHNNAASHELYLLLLKDEARRVVLAVLIDHGHGFLKGIIGAK